jgi:hypothetical protein
MTQAFNLAQLANNLNTSGQIDATDGLFGVIPVANGGTGQTSFTANNLLVGNGTSNLQTIAPGTSGNLLTSNGTSWVSAANNALGFNQTWQQPTRGASVTYTNSTGKPITVVISLQSGTVNGQVYLTIAGVIVSYAAWSHNLGSISSGVTLVGIVPPGQSYELTIISTWTLSYWSELR